MIQLHSDCLVFKMPDGEAIPSNAELVALQLAGCALNAHEGEILRQAALAVLHFFKHELGRDSITLGEFTQALDRVLRGFGLNLPCGKAPAQNAPAPATESDLSRLADASGNGELFFFPLLQQELHRQIQASPALVRFSGLRVCVMRLCGTRRWTPNCQRLNDEIVEYLRGCFSREAGLERRALLIS